MSMPRPGKFSARDPLQPSHSHCRPQPARKTWAKLAEGQGLRLGEDPGIVRLIRLVAIARLGRCKSVGLLSLVLNVTTNCTRTLITSLRNFRPGVYRACRLHPLKPDRRATTGAPPPPNLLAGCGRPCGRAPGCGFYRSAVVS